MGGFSAQVQQPQGNQSSGGKMGPIGQAVQQVSAPLDQNAINANPVGYKKWQNDAAQQGYSYSQQPNPNPDQGEPTNFGVPRQSPLADYQQTSRPVGKGGSVTNSSTSGQPRVGMPNQYSNTVGQWDNSQIRSPSSGGKGKGG